MSQNGIAALCVMAVYGFFVALGLGVLALKIFVVGSLITSSVKSLSDDCGKTYGVEAVVSGNWFCADE
jgi:hypothetical protein